MVLKDIFWITALASSALLLNACGGSGNGSGVESVDNNQNADNSSAATAENILKNSTIKPVATDDGRIFGVWLVARTGSYIDESVATDTTTGSKVSTKVWSESFYAKEIIRVMDKGVNGELVIQRCKDDDGYVEAYTYDSTSLKAEFDGPAYLDRSTTIVFNRVDGRMQLSGDNSYRPTIESWTNGQIETISEGERIEKWEGIKIANGTDYTLPNSSLKVTNFVASGGGGSDFGSDNLSIACFNAKTTELNYNLTSTGDVKKLETLQAKLNLTLVTPKLTGGEVLATDAEDYIKTGVGVMKNGDKFTLSSEHDELTVRHESIIGTAPIYDTAFATDGFTTYLGSGTKPDDVDKGETVSIKLDISASKASMVGSIDGVSPNESKVNVQASLNL